jgi:hypothetical protein
MNVRPPAPGFTLVEVIAILLVVVLGLFSVTGLFLYGLRLANRAQAGSTAMATAMSLAVDDAPLLDATGQWSRTSSYDLDDLNGSATARGYVNGYFVMRSESAVAADILAGTVGDVGSRSVRVEVDVYDNQGGELLASYTTRFVRVRNAP